MRYLRDPLGQTISRKIDGTKWTVELPGAPEGMYYIFTFGCNFTTKGNTVEAVTLIYQEDGNWRILGYSIQ